MRILLVEHAPDVRAVIALSLQDAGHEVIEADNAKAAIETLRKPGIAAVLTELRLPNGSGRAVAEGAERNKLPVLMFTGDLLLAEEMDQGGTRILRKPFPLRTLVQWLGCVVAGGLSSKLAT